MRGEAFINERYWELVQTCIRKEIGSQSRVIIAGPKSVEIRSFDFSPPKILYLYTDELEKKKIVRISDRLAVHFKPIASGRLTQKNLFPALKKTSESVVFPGKKPIQLRILSKEASVLDALLKHDANHDTYTVERFLSRGILLDRTSLGELVKLRYISSINRLRELAQKHHYSSLYDDCISIIRDE